MLSAPLWALFAPPPASAAANTAAWSAVGAVLAGSAWWAWRQQRVRSGPRRGRSAATAAAMSDRAAASARPALLRPASLDAGEVLDAARSRFLRLQRAWDEGDVAALGQLTTPDMLAQLLSVLDARGAGPNRTDIVSLHAELLALEEVSAAYLASVEFSGLIREDAEHGAVPFRELWMLSSSKDASPFWRLARQQALF